MVINLWGWIERKIKVFKMATGQIKGSQQLSQANDRDITLKNKKYCLLFQGNGFVFFFEITINIPLNGNIMLWEIKSFVV